MYGGLMTCRFLPVAVVLVLGAIASANPPADADNAAVLYEQAAKALPKAETRGERHVLLDVMSTLLTESVEPLLRRAEPGLALFDRASAATTCQWPLPKSRQFAASQMASIYGIDDLVILRARFRAARGDSAGALADCLNLAKMGRRIEQVKSTARQMQGGLQCNKALVTAGIVAPLVSKEVLARFAADFDALPAPVAPADVVAAEKPTFVLVHRRLIEDPEARATLDGMSDLIDDMVDVKSAPLKLDDLVDDAAKRDAVLKDVEALFDDMAAALRLPPEESAARWTGLSQRVQDSHPLTQRAWKVGVMARHVYDGQAIMRDLLRAALRVMESAEAKDDAVAAGLAAPYTFKRRPAGFELRHMPPGEKVPHVLTIGPHDPVDWGAVDKQLDFGAP
jgi:hypothetical protein